MEELLCRHVPFKRVLLESLSLSDLGRLRMTSKAVKRIVEEHLVRNLSRPQDFPKILGVNERNRQKQSNLVVWLSLYAPRVCFKEKKDPLTLLASTVIAARDPALLSALTKLQHLRVVKLTMNGITEDFVWHAVRELRSKAKGLEIVEIQRNSRSPHLLLCGLHHLRRSTLSRKREEGMLLGVSRGLSPAGLADYWSGSELKTTGVVRVVGLCEKMEFLTALLYLRHGFPTEFELYRSPSAATPSITASTEAFCYLMAEMGWGLRAHVERFLPSEHRRKIGLTTPLFELPLIRLLNLDPLCPGLALILARCLGLTQFGEEHRTELHVSRSAHGLISYAGIRLLVLSRRIDPTWIPHTIKPTDIAPLATYRAVAEFRDAKKERYADEALYLQLYQRNHPAFPVQPSIGSWLQIAPLMHSLEVLVTSDSSQDTDSATLQLLPVLAEAQVPLKVIVWADQYVLRSTEEPIFLGRKMEFFAVDTGFEHVWEHFPQLRLSNRKLRPKRR